MEIEGWRTTGHATEKEIEDYRSAEQLLSRYDGLLPTLRDWCGTGQAPASPWTLDQIARVAASDQQAREAIRFYLEGRWAPTTKLASEMRERLAWAVIEILDTNVSNATA